MDHFQSFCTGISGIIMILEGKYIIGPEEPICKKKKEFIIIFITTSIVVIGVLDALIVLKKIYVKDRWFSIEYSISTLIIAIINLYFALKKKPAK